MSLFFSLYSLINKTPIPNTSFILLLLLLSGYSSTGVSQEPVELFFNSPFYEVVRQANAERTASTDIDKNNKILVLNHGYEAFLLRIHLIRNATKSISVQTFIWRNDECGQLFMHELIAAARRGVQVKMIIDQIASEQDAEVIAFFSNVHPNFKLKYYNPVANKVNPMIVDEAFTFLTSFNKVNQRMHNKIITIDGIIGITGGRNIENKYFDYSTKFNFKDRDVMVIGPVVKSIDESFSKFWNYKRSIASSELKDVRKKVTLNSIMDDTPSPDFGSFFDDLESDFRDNEVIGRKFVDTLNQADRVRFVADLPGKNNKRGPWFFSGKGALTNEIEELIQKIQESLVIQTPYLVLSKRATSLLKNLRLENPNLTIKISTNSFAATDNIMAYSANYKLRATYIEDLKFDIREYIPYPADIENVNTRLPRLIAQLEEQHGDLETSISSASSEGEKLFKYVKQLVVPSKIIDSLARTLNIREEAVKVPFICIHAKSFVADGKVSFIGTYNLDPRSGNINTEVGLFIYDEAISAALTQEIEQDMKPGNSWRVARKAHLLEGLKNNPLQTLNYAFEKFSSSLSVISPIDLWPFHYTSTFELIEGDEDLPLEHPDFYDHYRDLGSFPGYGEDMQKEILTEVYRVFGGVANPIL